MQTNNKLHIPVKEVYISVASLGPAVNCYALITRVLVNFNCRLLVIIVVNLWLATIPFHNHQLITILWLNHRLKKKSRR